MTAFGIRDVKTSVHFSQSNGRAESYNSNLNSIFRVTLNETEFKNYDIYVKYVVFCLNNLICNRTGVSPHFLVHGRDARFPRDLLVQEDCNSMGEMFTENSDLDYTARRTAYNLHKNIGTVTRRVRERMKQRIRYMEKQYNKKVKGDKFEKGDLCMLLELYKKHKYSERWRGPYKVVKRISDNNYVVDIKGTPKVVNFSKMKRYVPTKYSNIIDVPEHTINQQPQPSTTKKSEDHSSDDDTVVILAPQKPPRRSPRLLGGTTSNPPAPGPSPSPSKQTLMPHDEQENLQNSVSRSTQNSTSQISHERSSGDQNNLQNSMSRRTPNSSSSDLNQNEDTEQLELHESNESDLDVSLYADANDETLTDVNQTVSDTSDSEFFGTSESVSQADINPTTDDEPANETAQSASASNSSDNPINFTEIQTPLSLDDINRHQRSQKSSGTKRSVSTQPTYGLRPSTTRNRPGATTIVGDYNLRPRGRTEDQKTDDVTSKGGKEKSGSKLKTLLPTRKKK